MGLHRALRPEIWLFALVFGCYAYFYQAGGWNQNARFALVRALVEQHALHIDPYKSSTGDLAARADHFYCDKAPGVSFLAAPPYAVFHALWGRGRTEDARQAYGSYLCTLWAVGLPSTLAALALWHLLRAWRLSPTVSAAIPIAYALGTPAFPYSTLLYGHQTAAALLLLGFALVAVPLARADVVSRTRLFGAGLAWGGAITTEYTSVLPVAVLMLYAALRSRRRGETILWLASGLLGPLALLAAYHTAAFGGPLRLPYDFSVQRHRHGGFFMGLALPDPVVLREILFGEFRGVFPVAPWLLLSVPGALALVARKDRRLDALACAAIAASYVLINAALNDWHGGWGIGARHLLPALPFLALLAAAVWLPTLGRRAAALTAGVAAAGIVFAVFMMTVATAVKPEVPHSYRAPYQAFLFPAFFEGRLALNVQSVGMSRWRGLTERQAWNLGEKMGLHGLGTLAPLVLYGLVTGGLWLRAARRQDPADGNHAKS
jgi:hypothetical protein